MALLSSHQFSFTVPTPVNQPLELKLTGLQDIQHVQGISCPNISSPIGATLSVILASDHMHFHQNQPE